MLRSSKNATQTHERNIRPHVPGVYRPLKLTHENKHHTQNVPRLAQPLGTLTEISFSWLTQGKNVLPSIHSTRVNYKDVCCI